MRISPALAIAIAAVSITTANAQQRTYYDSTGRSVGREVTGSNGATTIYGADGRVTGRTSTSTNGTVTVYGSDGRRVGTITKGR